jgi:hypothetical protein
MAPIMMANARNPETHPGFCATRANLPTTYKTAPIRPHIPLSVWIKGAWKTIGRKKANIKKRTPANRKISDGELRG